MRRRHAFTLVEMLVTLALVLFIMVILSEAFSAGLGTFRQLKAIGDMQERLRSVATILRHDLQNHYLSTGTSPATAPYMKLDDPSFGPPPTGTGPTFTVPALGFFRIEQLTAPAATGSYVQEPTNAQEPPSFRSAGSHRLYFTIRIPQLVNSQRREGYLSANVPPSSGGPDKLDSLGPADYGYNPTISPPTNSGTGVYYSQSAEVAYFLRSLGTSGQTPGATQSNPGGTPTQLFGLFRRQLLLMDGTPTDATSANTAPSPPASSIWNYQDVSCRPQLTLGPPPGPPTLVFNSLSDVAANSITTGNKRCLTLSPLNFSVVVPPGTYDNTASGSFPYPILGNRGESQNVHGDDLLLTNVVSFSVRVLPAGQYDFTDISSLAGGTAPFVYDTGFIATPMPATQNYRIAALEITIRVWDIKTQQTRQMTIIQDMGGLNSPSVP